MPLNVDPLVARVGSFLRRVPALGPRSAVLVAVSGGSDSLALLHLLATVDLPLRLTAAYIDHTLRPVETPGEHAHISLTCQRLGIPFVSASVDVPLLVATEGRSPEEAARHLRYKELERLRSECGAAFIALGHTADDQVEEFFLRLLRGAGRQGFCGMARQRGRLLRPLLTERKASLIDYLQKNGLSWCVDSSNAEHHYLRNRVRLDLLPLLESRFSPAIRDTVLRTMAIFSEEEELLATLGEQAWQECLCPAEAVRPPAWQAPGLVLDIASCRRQHVALLRRVVEKCLWSLGGRPSYARIAVVIDFIKSDAQGGELHLGGGLRARRARGELHLFCLPVAGPGRIAKVSRQIEQTITGPGSHSVAEVCRELRLAITPAQGQQPTGSLQVDADKVTFPLLLRSPQSGERFRPCHGAGSKKVNRYLNERGIPAAERHSWPLLCDGEGIIALVGLDIDQSRRVSAATTQVLEIEWRPLPGSDDRECDTAAAQASPQR